MLYRIYQVKISVVDKYTKTKIRCLRFIVPKVSRKRYTFNSTNLYLEIFRLEPVTYCRPEPPCVVTDIPKRGTSIARKPYIYVIFQGCGGGVGVQTHVPLWIRPHATRDILGAWLYSYGKTKVELLIMLVSMLKFQN